MLIISRFKANDSKILLWYEEKIIIPMEYKIGFYCVHKGLILKLVILPAKISKSNLLEQPFFVVARPLRIVTEFAASIDVKDIST